MLQPGGKAFTYDYDATGRVMRIDDENAATAAALLTFGYDMHGRLTGRTKGAGSSVGYGYDAASRLESAVGLNRRPAVGRAYGAALRSGCRIVLACTNLATAGGGS